MRRLLVMDVDSTMIQQEVIELLAVRVGLEDQVKTITEQAMSGEIDFTRSLLDRVSLLEGLEVNVLDELQSEIVVTDGVKELIDLVQSTGGLVGAISGGFSQVLEPLALRLGLDLYKANDLEISDGLLTGRVSGEIVDGDCKASTLRSWADDFGFDLRNTVAIGDGANDISMLQAAGFAVAFRPKEILRQYADLVLEENSLFPLVQVLELRTS